MSLSERTVHRTTQALLMEGMRRLDEWSRLSELLPSFDTVLELDPEMLRERLREMPDEQNEMVRLIDGQRSIGRLLLAHGGDHVDALRKIVDLYFEGMVREAGTIKDSIPILTEVTVKSSPPPVKEGVNTIPGPAGRRAVDVSVPGAPVLPEISDASSAVTAREMRAAPRSPSASVPAPAGGSASAPVSVPASASAPAPATAPSDQLTTPVSLPTPDAQPINASGEPILTPSGPPTVLAPQTGSPPEQDRVWEPAPPPATPRPRQQTPTGFQTAQPESSMYAGGTILNWAGRVRTIDASEDASSRETVEVGTWDHTLDELRSDPEVADAIEAIDSDPPPAPFVRSRPPSDRAIDQAIERGEAQRSNAPVVREEPPVADRPRTDYEHVFEKEEGGSLKAPLPVRGPIAMQQRDSGPLMLPWALVLVLIVAGTGLFAYLLGSGPGSESEKPIVTEAARGPSTETATRAPTDTATRADTDIATGAAAETATATETAAAAGGETTAAETATAAPSEPAPGSTPVENPEAVYAATGVADTYEAQLALARRLKRGSRAVAAYRRAIALNPEASPALAELARLMLARQNTREASELAERATAIDPSNALAWVTLGAARQMRGDRQGARQAYRNCAKLGKGRYVRECRAMLR